MATHRAYLESATGFIETTVEDITFDEFSAFAAERNETLIEHPRKKELAPEGISKAGSVL